MEDIIFTFNKDLALKLIDKGFIVKNICNKHAGWGFENNLQLRQEIIKFEKGKGEK